jgi:hypothetical protein
MKHMQNQPQVSRILGSGIAVMQRADIVKHPIRLNSESVFHSGRGQHTRKENTDRNGLDASNEEEF